MQHLVVDQADAIAAKARLAQRRQKITLAEMRDMGVRPADLLLALQVQPPDHHERRPLA